MLKVHKLEGERFYPYGYYGRFEADFALPVEDPATLDMFERDFNLRRGQEPGTSVILPYPDPSLSPAAISESVVRHYFMPILAGDLVVEVVQGERVERPNAESLTRRFTAVQSGEGASLARVFELARWAMSVEDGARVLLGGVTETAAPRWDDETLPANTLDALRAAFQDGHPIAVRASVWAKPEHGASTLSNFDVYLQRDDALEKADEHFVRDGITVTGVRAGLPKGVHSLVVIRERALSSLVGDAENPAHTEWQERSLKFKDKYRHGAFTLRYIRTVPRELVRVLTRPVEGRDYTLLRQLGEQSRRWPPCSLV